MRVAITGGTGFIGSHVADRMIADGHTVRVLDAVRPEREDVEFAAVDICDLDGLVRELTGIDAVFHLAAMSNVDVCYEQPVQTLTTNVTGTANVWEAARRNELQRAVLASTVWVYNAAPGPGPLDETTPLDPSASGHLYTASKIAAELVVQEYHRLYGLPYTIFRYGIPYGPRMRPELVIPRFVSMALAGETITIHGDGSQYRAYIAVEDLARAHAIALAPAGENQVFNLEGLEEVSVRQLAEAVLEVVGGDARVEFLEGRPGDFAGKVVSAAKARDVLGWSPAITFSEGLRRYVDWHLHDQARHRAGGA